jgi:DnaA family protein
MSDPAATRCDRSPAVLPAGARQLLLDLLPPPPPSFDNFITGANGEALAALRDWLTAADPPLCFLLWGEAASGRRHLLAASGLPLIDANAEAAARLGAETAAAIAVADLDRLDEAGQTALFNAFNRRRAAGGRLLVSSHQPPAALAMREDLRTRLGSGLVYRLLPLSEAEKETAMQRRAAALGLALPAGALGYLLARCPRDLGTLLSVIDALDRFTLERRRPVTMPLLRELLAALPGDPRFPA